MKHFVLFLLLTTSVAAQDNAVPQLKPLVEIQLRTMREQFLAKSVQILQLQQQQAQLTNQYNAALSTALKDSKIDDTKYVLDSETLVVAAKQKEDTK